MSLVSSGGYNFKVVLLGEGCVGKTSIVLRYVEDKFHPKHITTLQASFLTKKVNLDGKRVHLNLWDTAGQERFHALGPIYYRSSNGAILVYDITDEESFQKVKNWVKELKKMLGSDIVIIIVGNKIDLEKNRTVAVEDAESYAQKVGAAHYETSAKTNEGIETLFLDLSAMMIANHDKIESRNSSLKTMGSIRRTNTLVVDDTEETSAETQPTKCCGAG